MIRSRFLEALAVSSVLLGACGTSSPGPATYTVTYDGNGSTGGAAPVDSNHYTQGQAVTVLGNTGNLVDAGHAFSAWNTAASGSGTRYLQGQTFTMGAADVTLFAQWSSGGALSVTYDANGATGGAVPVDSNGYSASQTVTVLGNTGALTRTGYRFVAWEANADGSGKAYAPGKTFTLGSASVTLYALWASGFVYAVNHNDGGEGGISQLWIGPNGALTSMFTAVVDSAGTDPRFLTADPAGKHLYVSNITSNKLGQFNIGADGALTAMTPATVAEQTYPLGLAVNPAGSFAYVANNQSATISQYTIGASGALTAMTPATVAAGSGWPMQPDMIKVHPSGSYAYLTAGGGQAIAQYKVGSDGTLSPLSPATAAAGSNAYALAFASLASGVYVYVTNYDTGAIWEYRVQADGTLASLGTVATAGTYAFFVAVHPTGKWAYAGILASTADKVLAQFNIGTDGKLALMSTPYVSAGGPAAVGVAIDPSGRFLYSTSGETGWGSTYISQFTIDQATGALTLMATPKVGTGATGPNELVTVAVQP